MRDCINRSHVDELDDREMDEFLDDPQAQQKFKFKWQKTSNPRNPMKVVGNLVFGDHVLSGIQGHPSVCRRISMSRLIDN